MIITRKETRDQDRGEGRNERKTSDRNAVKSREGRIGSASSIETLPDLSFNDDDFLSFFFFSKYLLSISRIIETLDSSTLRMSLSFSSRYVRKKKRKGKKKEDKRERREEEWRGGGRKRGRKAKETARGREERHNGANEKEEGGEKG